MRKQISIGIFAALVIAGGVLGYQRWSEAKADEIRQKAEAENMARAKAESARLEIADLALESSLPMGYQRPGSSWQTNEKTFFQKMFLAGKYDVLVFPLQIQQWGFDAATRSLMAAQLAAAIAQTQAGAVADPYLVARAMGDGQRQLSMEELYNVASSVGAKRFVWGYVGHDRKGKMVVTLMVHDALKDVGPTAWTPAKEHKFTGIPFGEEGAPLEAYRKLLPKMVGSMGFDPAALSNPRPESRLKLSSLPDSPLKLISKDDEAARDAYTYLLFSALTPDHVSRAKSRYAEKAFLALDRMSPESPEYRVLQARAYMAMGYRVAAIKALGTPQTDEEIGLLAAFNGNLTDLRAMVGKERHPLKRLLLKFHEVEISRHYDLTNSNRILEELKSFDIPGQIWPFLVARAVTDGDAWVQHENLHVKMLLDFELPVKGNSLEDIMRAGQTVGDPAKLQVTVDLSVFHHGRQFLESEAAKWCCTSMAGQPGVADYLELLQAIGHDNLMRRIRFFSSVQGSDQRALQYADTLDAVYKGNPYYMLERSRVESRLSRVTSGPEKEVLLKSAYVNAFNAMYLEQGQSRVSNEAQEQFNSLGRNDFGQFNNFYYTDIPFKPYFWTWADGGSPQVIGANINAALNNAAWHIEIVPRLMGHYRLGGDEAAVKKLLQSIDGRFEGSPQRNELLAHEELRVGNLKAAEEYYRKNITLIPGYWASYSDLGKMLFESGSVREASRLFSSYPGFKKNSGENRVLIANLAFEVGSHFYWSGHFDLAQPFYSLSEAQQAGAGGDMTSALRLKLLNGDIAGALLGAYQKARRYNDSYSYRDYLGILHASGYSKDAWAGFSALIREIPKPHMWETALVGHHMAGASEDEVVQWLRQESNQKTAERTNTAARYLVRFATTDRTPSAGLSAIVESIDAPVWRLEGVSSWVVRPSEDGSTGTILGPDLNGQQSMLPLGVFASSKKQRVKPHLAYFAEAYRAIKNGDYLAARKVFDEAEKLYDMTMYADYMLPYYAFAAAKSGDTATVEALLQRIKPERQKFDFHLASAVLAALKGKTDDAMHALSLARYRRPYTEGRPLLTQFTYGDVCELLAKNTGNAKILALAVDWARQSQRSEPWQSWGYAVEAMLTTNAADRKRAIAMLHYLDSKSERLATFRKQEINEAVAMYSKSNIFLRKPLQQLPGMLPTSTSGDSDVHRQEAIVLPDVDLYVDNRKSLGSEML